MNNILQIRQRLGLSQAAFGAAIEVSQGNVSHYENDRQEMPIEVARRLIAAAEKLGHVVTLNDIYLPPASGAVTCEELRPDLAEQFAYLRSTGAKQAA